MKTITNFNQTFLQVLKWTLFAIIASGAVVIIGHAMGVIK